MSTTTEHLVYKNDPLTTKLSNMGMRFGGSLMQTCEAAERGGMPDYLVDAAGGLIFANILLAAYDNPEWLQGFAMEMESQMTEFDDDNINANQARHVAAQLLFEVWPINGEVEA